MRQKKSNLLFYIAVAAVITLTGLIAVVELPANIEHVEESVK